MSRIAIITPRLESHDAIGNDAIHMQRVLSEKGQNDVRLYAPTWEYEGEVHHTRDLLRFIRADEDIIIYHASVFWDQAVQLLKGSAGHKIIKHHNITPAEFFDEYHQGYAAACRRGREGLTGLVGDHIDLYLGDSQFNLDELMALGARPERCHVLPPFHRIDRLLHREADLDTLGAFGPDAFGGYTNLLMVGRLVPNKGHRNLLHAFAAYRDAFEPNARLVLAGKQDPGLGVYYEELQKTIQRLDIADGVVFASEVSEAALKSLYLTAHALVVMSEHEGFCVPLLEAMALGVPIVALARGAVPETLGNGGICWEDFDATVVAASIDRLNRDEVLRDALIDQGQRRYHEVFATSVLEKRFVELLAPFLPSELSP